MLRIDVSFILLAVVCLIGGICLGIGMGASQNFQFTPVHAHLSLVGWVSLALFGLIYKAYPALSQSWLAKIHILLSGSTAIVFPLGIYVALAHQNPAFATAAAFAALGGVLVFFANLLRVFVFANGAKTAAEEAVA
jgi:hypothetical protein